MSGALCAVIGAIKAVPAGVAGSLSYTTVTYAAEDVTAAGYEDYFMPGPLADGSTDGRKTTGGGRIGSFALTNMTRLAGSAGDFAITSTDSSPNNYNRADAGQWQATVPANVADVTVPVVAGTATRVVDVIVGAYPAGAVGNSRLYLALSDASATPLDISIPNLSNFTRVFTRYRVTYNAATNGQQLLVTNRIPAGSNSGFRAYYQLLVVNE